MKQHKWHKEIKAWADGAEIERWYNQYDGWRICLNPIWNAANCEFRIKPQSKETKYLYVYYVDGEIKLIEHKSSELIPCKNPLNVFCIGKIKLEHDNE